MHHFEYLYESSIKNSSRPYILSLAPLSSIEERNDISRNITINKIKHILFNMSPHKVPGPDGLTVGFFMWRWKLIGPHIYSIIRDFLHPSTLPQPLNDMLIVLIPKKENPT